MNRPMRRSTREITDPAELDAVLDQAAVLSIALHDEPAPYVLPVCFGRVGRVLYVHSAASGAKIDLLRARPEVGFSASTEMSLRPGATACAWGCQARSVCGTGTARITGDPEERRRGLEAIMRHYAADAPVDFSPESLARTCVIAIDVASLRGKRVG
jgi:uncharacterized protein